jgi:hypothetical protein
MKPGAFHTLWVINWIRNLYGVPAVSSMKRCASTRMARVRSSPRRACSSRACVGEGVKSKPKTKASAPCMQSIIHIDEVGV